MKKFTIAFVSSIITIILMFAFFTYFFYSQENSVAKEISPNESQNEIYLPASQIDNSNANNLITKSRKNVITETVQKVSPAVVGINVTEIRQYRSAWSQDPFFRQFFGDRVYQREVKGLGSGAIISPDGYVLTNDHVAGNASKVIVTLTDGSQYDAKVIGSDLISDVCLLKIEAENLPYIKFANSDETLIGEWAIAFGNPFGLFEINDKPTVTVGVVSATGMNLGFSRDRYYLNMIQTDASINQGNSGGPLVNGVGEMIGINTLIYSESGGSVGVGFAIPINKVSHIIDEIKENGKVDRNFWTGLSIQTIDEGIARYYNLGKTRGVIVTHVQSDSPADNAGIKVGDIVTKVNSYRIDDENMLIGVLQEYRNGDVVKISLLRDNKKLTEEMKLESRND